ncbi:MAG TPA: hypothetical protein VGF41_02770 [Myxococcaceae bacterium]
MTTVTQPETPPDRRAAAYLVAQGIGVLVWWVAVIGSRAVRDRFFPYGGLDPAFAAFFVPDLILLVGVSLVVARHRLRGVSAPRASGVLLGAVAYGTLYTAAWTFLLHAPPWGLVAMLVIALGTWLSCD